MEELAATFKTKSNFYDILGVEKDATEDQLKKAYRKVSAFGDVVDKLSLVCANIAGLEGAPRQESGPERPRSVQESRHSLRNLE